MDILKDFGFSDVGVTNWIQMPFLNQFVVVIIDCF